MASVVNSVTRNNGSVVDAARNVVVVGAGAAGMAAAISAARSGATVRLADVAPRAGGTVSGALIHTLAGIYNENREIINDGIVCELVERLQRASSLTRPRKIGKTWCLNVCPAVYRNVVEGWIAEEKLIQTAFAARVTQVAVAGGAVEHLELSDADSTKELAAGALIDTTGTAEMVRLIDPSLVYDDEDRAAGGLIFRLRGVEPGAMAFPRGIVLVQKVKTAARDGELPALCAHAWIDQGVFDDEVFVKLFVPLAGGWNQRRGEILAGAERLQEAIVDYLKRLPEFAQARVSETGALGVRDGGRIKGEYYLTADDVRSGRSFADAACRCCWPIEYWHPRTGLELEYLPAGATYEIPLRALKVAGLKNVWAAGKCLSADHRAQASARVVGQCWAMGQAVGREAAAATMADSRRPAFIQVANQR